MGGFFGTHDQLHQYRSLRTEQFGSIDGDVELAFENPALMSLRTEQFGSIDGVSIGAITRRWDTQDVSAYRAIWIH